MILEGALPDPLARHLELVLDPTTPPATHVESFGEGRVRRRVLRRFHPPVPITWRLDLAPGRAFRWDVGLRVLDRSLTHASAQYREGHGRLEVGGRAHEGVEIDGSERTLLWAWTMALAPEALLAAPSTVFEAAGPDVLVARFGAGEPPHELRFGREGLLLEVATDRFNLESGEPVPWRVRFDDYRTYGSVRAPRQVTTHWEERAATHLILTKLIRTPHGPADAPT